MINWITYRHPCAGAAVAIATLALCTFFPLPAGAQRIVADSISVVRRGDAVQLTMRVTVGKGKLAASRLVTLTPRLVGPTDSVDFPELALVGRHVYYHIARAGHASAVSPDGQVTYRKGRAHTLRYARTIPWQTWMDRATLHLLRTEATACGDLLDQTLRTVQVTETRRPVQRVFEDTRKAAPPVMPRGTLRDDTTYYVRGTAHVIYPVSRTNLDPLHNGNRAELDSIRRTIDEVRLNPAARFTKLTLHGYASPEAPYEYNSRLAFGRTEALRQYIIDNWHVPSDQIVTDFTPEDWDGLRRQVADHQGELRNGPQILAIIDQRLHPDDKLAAIQTRYPDDYRYMLRNWFPALRRCDYRINYEWHEPLPTASAAAPRVRTLQEEELQRAVPPATALPQGRFVEDTRDSLRSSHLWFALKTNLLFDAVLAPNIEVEMQLGRDSRWSLMVEDWFPWFRYRPNRRGDSNRYRRSDQRPTRNSYQVWTLGAELRYWLAPRCREARPALSGTFIGLYGAGGKYDWETSSKGWQGEFTSIGLSVGHSWVLSRHWNLELSAAVGYVGGPQRYYEAEFDDARLIFRRYDRLRYIGPTKLKLSLAWLLF